MSERMTKEREAEIRDAVQSGNENAGRHRLETWCADLLAEIDALRAAPPTTYLHADGTEEPIGELVARLTRERDGWRLRADDLTSQRDGQERDAIAARAEAGAERKARMALEARVRELLDAHAKLLDRLETAKARVRELEAERAGLVTAEAYGQATAALAEDLAATRAQLGRLREAALMLADRVRAEGGHGHRVHELSDRVLDALSIPGPTLASVRAEALRWDALNAERSVWTARAEKAEATLAETRARLTGLWEAAEAVDEADASGDDTVLGVALRHLRAALSTPGPTLAEIRALESNPREIRPSVDGDLDAAVDRAQAEGRVLDLPALVRLCMDPRVETLVYAITEAGAVFLFDESAVCKMLAEIRRAAQVEGLRDAVDTACDAVLAAVPCCNGTAAVHAVRRSLEKRADDLEAGRE